MNAHAWFWSSAVAVTGIVAAATLGAAAEPNAGQPAAADFDRDIAPILVARCVECHRPGKAKGGYQLHTWTALLKPGRGGQIPISEGRPDASPLVHRLQSTDSDERMPQDSDPLSTREIDRIRRWIQSGAKAGAYPPETLLTVVAAAAVPQPVPPEHYPKPVPIHALAFSPDGTAIVAGGYHEVIVWRSTRRNLLRRIWNIARQVQQIEFSPDGQTLAIAAGTPGRMGEIKLFEFATGNWIRTLAASGDLMLTVAYSPDGKRLAAGGADNSIVLFDAASGAVAFRGELNADWVMHVAFSPDGQRIVAASRDKTVRILNTATGELEETYANHTDPVYAAVFTSDGTRVVSGGRDRTIHLWQASDARKLAQNAPMSTAVQRLVRFGDRLYSGLASGEIIEHQIEAKSIKHSRVIGRHGDGIGALAIHEGSKSLATAGYDGQLRIWNLESGEMKSAATASP